MGLARFIPSRIRDVLDPYRDLTYNVLAYGALGDGSTDDTTAIQAAITAAAATGGIVYFPIPTSSYVVNGTLDLTDISNVALVGEASTRNQHGATGGVQLKRVTGTGTMLTWTASSTTSITGARIENIGFDGNSLAATGVLLGDWYGCMVTNAYVRNCTTVNYDLVGGHTSLGFQNNVFNGIDSDTFSTGAIAMRWRSYSPGSGNVSLNNFHKLGITHKDGTGLDCGDSDSNFVYGMQCSTGHTGTGVSVLLRGSATPGGGHARSNNFFGCQPVNGVTAQGTDTGGVTQPSHHNRFYVASENTVPAPTYGTGATLLWALDTGVTYLPNNTLTYSRNNAGTSDVSMWRIDTSDQLVTPTYTSLNGGASVSGGELRVLGGGGALYGLDLTGGSFSTGAMLIPNNVALYGINQAGSGAVNMWRIDTSNHVVTPTYTSMNGGASISGADLTMASNIAMGSNKITGLGAATANGDALRYEQLVGLYLLLAGGTMSGNIAMGSNKITGLGNATVNGDAVGWPWPLIGGLLNVQVFKAGANQTWTNPNVGTVACVFVKGGGGGGGGGVNSASAGNPRSGGAGGGAGGWMTFAVPIAALPASANVNVASGGAGGTNGVAGSDANRTTAFDSGGGNGNVTAATGGAAGSSGASTGGNGGTATAPTYAGYSVTSVVTNGGTGGAGTTAASAGGNGATGSGGAGGGVSTTPTGQSGGVGTLQAHTSTANGAAGVGGASGVLTQGSPSISNSFLGVLPHVSGGGGGGGCHTNGTGGARGANGYQGGGGGGGGSSVNGPAGLGGNGGDGLVVVLVF